MLQLRPTFSESWYRVAKLKAKLRSSAHISRQFYRGERWYVVRDPAGNQYHRLSDAAYRFVALLDGNRTIEEAWDLCGGTLADDAPTQPEVIQILTHLYSANLVEADITPDAKVLLRRQKQLTQRRWQSRMMNVLFPRIPLWDTDQFLVRWLPLVRQLFSKAGGIVWILVVGAALFALGPHWSELKIAAKNAISPSNWVYLWAVFVLVKLVHELGHAFGCRRFGGECHELGIMFLVFIPTPYVDASAAWSFPNRWHRMFVGAAGMIVELFLAAILAFVWINIGDKQSLSAMLCYNAMFIASVSTVMFNANPLLRYDGYYILSDFLEIPNLRQKSTEYTMGLVKRHVFGVKATQPLPPVLQRFWLFSYATASSIYRIFVGLLIIMMVGFQVPVLGALMALGGVATWLIVPTVTIFKYLTVEPELHRKRGKAWAFTLACATAIVLLIGVIPWPVHVRADGMLEPGQREVLNAKVGGFVTEIKVKHFDQVKKGDVLVVCRNEETETEIAELKARVRAVELHRKQALSNDQAQARIDEVQLAGLNDQLSQKQKIYDDLTIRASIDGTVIAPHLEELQGAYVQPGKELLTVAQTQHLIARVTLSQDDAELIGKKQEEFATLDPDTQKMIDLCLAGKIAPKDDGKPLRVVGARMINGAQDQLPSAALGYQGGGQMATDPSDQTGTRALQMPYELRVEVDNPGMTYLPGQRAFVRFTLDKKPLIWDWTRKIYQLINERAQTGSKLAT